MTIFDPFLAKMALVKNDQNDQKCLYVKAFLTNSPPPQKWVIFDQNGQKRLYVKAFLTIFDQNLNDHLPAKMTEFWPFLAPKAPKMAKMSHFWAWTAHLASLRVVFDHVLAPKRAKKAPFDQNDQEWPKGPIWLELWAFSEPKIIYDLQPWKDPKFQPNWTFWSFLVNLTKLIKNDQNEKRPPSIGDPIQVFAQNLNLTPPKRSQNAPFWLKQHIGYFPRK